MAITRPSIRCKHCGHYHSDYKITIGKNGAVKFCAKCGKQM